MSASADKSLKLWSLEIEDEEIKLAETERIDTPEEVMGVKFSPDGVYLLYSLLDNTVRIIQLSSMKQYLSLYGHSLPV